MMTGFNLNPYCYLSFNLMFAPIIARSVFAQLLCGGALLMALGLAGRLPVEIGAAAFGGGLALCATLLGARAAWQVGKASMLARQLGLAVLYFSYLLRCAVIGAGLAYGLIALALPPLWLFVGLLACLIAPVFGLMRPMSHKPA